MKEFIPKGIRKIIINALGGEVHDRREKVDYIPRVPALDPIPSEDASLSDVLRKPLYEERTDFLNVLHAAGLTYYQSHRVIDIVVEMERCARKSPLTVGQIRALPDDQLWVYFHKADIERRYLDQAVGLAKKLLGPEPKPLQE